MTYNISNLTAEERDAAEKVVDDMRRKQRDKEERQLIVANLSSVWPDGKPVIYIARQNSDLTEGRGGYVDMGHFIDKKLAEQANALLPGVFGTPNDSPVKKERLFLTLAEWREVMRIR